MSKDRLVAFTDAILAIIMTLLVLGLTQPKSDTWTAIWAEHNSYIAYALSFFSIAVRWNNNHHIMQLVKVINGKVLWAVIFFLFVLSFTPFITTFLATYFYGFVAQFLYAVVIFISSLTYYWLYFELYRADPHNKHLKKALFRPVKIAATFGVEVVGLILCFWYPPLALIGPIGLMIIWMIPEPKVELDF